MSQLLDVTKFSDGPFGKEKLGDRPIETLVQIQVQLASVAFDNASKDPVAAFRAHIAGLFVPNPLLRSHLSPIRDGP